jgi:carboxyl-terminal processing protease
MRTFTPEYPAPASGTPIPAVGRTARRVTILAAAILLAGSPATAQQPDRTLSPQAAAYLAEALAVIRDNALRSDSVDWTELRHAAFDSAAGARVPVDTYRAIRFALRSLGDHHSFLQLSAELRQAEEDGLRERGLLGAPAAASSDRPVSPFAERRLPEGDLHRQGGRAIARVVVPHTGALSTEDFATRLHETVRQLATDSPCGWIVDLRGNGGGNMWPMLAGVGPLLGEDDELGSFVGPQGLFGSWYYRDGEAGMTGVDETDSFVGATIRGAAYRLPSSPPVAVLIDGFTGSSGEAVAIAFKGRPSTRFFGLPSAGLSTSNDGFRLADGANLVITVGVDVDRTGKLYPREVLPDEEVPYGEGAGADDPQLARAVEWLMSTSTCR